jgi:hypothetical protein
MKLILESWRKYINETETSSTTATSEQVELVRDFLKKIAIIAQAAADAEEELGEASIRLHAGARRGRRATVGRRQQRHRRAIIQRTKYIKQLAGLTGTRKEDFTSDEERIYLDAKKKIEEMEDAHTFTMINTLANGNLANVSWIQKILNKGGAPLKFALSAVLTGECIDDFSLNCLSTEWLQAAQQTGMME